MGIQDLTGWLERLGNGDRRAIGKLISWVEDGWERERIMAAIAARSGQARIVGITGPPGAGKSSLLECLTTLYRSAGERVGIVAVDPSSPYTGGAILGDRLRLQAHNTDPEVFVRSMGTRGFPGGVARSALDVLRLLEAGGYSRLLLETVGVGQSEVAVMGLADTVVVVLNPGAGDGVQAIKAGIMEIADIFVVNKADLPGAKQLKKEIELMLDLTPAGQQHRRPPVILTSTFNGLGLVELQEQIALHQHSRPESMRGDTGAGQLGEEVCHCLEAKVRQRFELLWPSWSERAWTKMHSPQELADLLWQEILQGGDNHE